MGWARSQDAGRIRKGEPCHTRDLYLPLPISLSANGMSHNIVKACSGYWWLARPVDVRADSSAVARAEHAETAYGDRASYECARVGRGDFTRDELCS